MRYKMLLFWGVGFCGVCIFLQCTSRFHFYYVEQLQLFLNTLSYARENVLQTGGGALYLSRLLTQFFILPGGGALIVSCLFVVTGRLVQLILQKLSPGKDYYLFSLLPPLALLMLHWDSNCLMQGTIAYLFMLVALYGYLSVTLLPRRLATGILLILLLYVTAGAVTTLFVGCAMLIEVMERSRGWYYSVLFAVAWAGIVFLSFHQGLAGEYKYLWLPVAYIDPFITLDKIYYSWAILPLLLIATWAIRKKHLTGKWMQQVALPLQLGIFVLLLGAAWNRYGNESMQKVERLDYYSRTGQWDKIIDSYSLKDATLYSGNLLNMALARKGELGNLMFHYDQRGWETLVMEWGSGVFGAIPLCDIYYWIGDIPKAQKYAFEGYVASIQGGNVRLLKRMIETNLIMGAYPVAEKYIDLLEHTLFYKKDARYYRSFLYNDGLVEKDAVLGSRRKCYKTDELITYSGSIEKELERVALNNPQSRTAFHYLVALYLSTGKMKKYRSLVEKYYGTPVWPSLAVSHQEAVILLAPDDPKYWVQHGVSLDVEQRYGAFSQDLVQKRNYMNFEQWMAENYGNTYWYYLMFKK